MTTPNFSALIYEPTLGVFYRFSEPNLQLLSVGNHGYIAFKVGGKKYLAHRVAWYITHGVWPEGEIDHINGIRTDNRIVNLRDVTRQKNVHNQSKPQKGNRSGYLGVMWNSQRNKWVARITVDGKRKRLGSFQTAQEAYAAYIEAKKIHHPTAFHSVAS